MFITPSGEGARYASCEPSGDRIGDVFSGLPKSTSLGMSSSEVVRAIDRMGLWRDKLRGDAFGKVKAPLPTKGRTRAERAKVGIMLRGFLTPVL